ncbi:MAG: discoidin domain-containing protein, partial [Phycisphaerales bacterium]
MCQKSICLTSFVLTMALATVAGADWVAYNDLSDGNGGTAALGLNVTTYTYLDTNRTLMDFQTGAMLTVTMTGEIVGDGDTNGDVYPNNGGNCNTGTDADNVFGGILDLTGGNELDTTAEHKAIIFNGLNPVMSYTITLTSNRANAPYTNRWSTVTIEGADAYTYAASAGVLKLSEAAGEFCVGYNTVDGYVMKWTDISCGADGSFSIKSENADRGGKGYAMMAFKLEEFALGNATDPSPADEVTDVPRDVVLSWTPGIYAPPVNGHRIYLGKSFSDVNDGTGGVALDNSSYDPGRLDLGSTYYWRVDEVNAPPDSTVYKGEVWSFTTEPVGYAIDGANITATASSVGGADFGPDKTIDSSGLDADDLHSTDATDMWLSDNEPSGAWIQYDLDKVYRLHEMWVWNSNQTFEALFGFGFKDVTVEYSTNGTEWTALADVPQFTKASGMAGYAHNTTVDFGGAVAQYVRLTANSNWGGILP